MAKTWRQLRQEISRRLNEPVMRRVGTELSIAGALASNTFHSTQLANLTTEWGVAYGSAYVSYTTDSAAPLGEELEIQRFRSDGSVGYAYTGGVGFTASLGAGDKVEIREFFTARQILDAVNQAIRDSWPAFYDTTVDQSIIMEKFKRVYDLTTLSPRIRHLVGAYLEPIYRVGIGIAEVGNSDFTASVDAAKDNGDGTYDIQFLFPLGGSVPQFSGDNYIFINDTAGYAYNATYVSSNTIRVTASSSPADPVDTGHIIFAPKLTNQPEAGNYADFRYNIVSTGLNFSPVANTNYEAVIYYGPGLGSIMAVDTSYETTNGVYLDSAPSATLTTRSEFMIKNISDVYYNWLGPLTRIRLDRNEDPESIEILYDTYEIWGARVRLEYASVLSELSADTDTIPDSVAGYVIPRALYYLYLQNIGRSAQFDVKTAATLADQYNREAEAFRQRNRMKTLSGTIKTDGQYVNWSDREMPFKR